MIYNKLKPTKNYNGLGKVCFMFWPSLIHVWGINYV